MTTRGDPKRAALVLVPRDLASVDQYLAELTRRKPREWPFTHNPGHVRSSTTCWCTHGIDVAGVSALAGYPTRREHALAEIAVLGGLPELREAEEWTLANAPPDEPSVLLHGDLLGQNILLHPSEPPAIIDWEAARLGDPAYDLAIVTRGVRRPFQIERGLERLLDTYAACAPWRITASAVHLHELCLAGRWYREALEGVNAREPADQALRRVEQVLARARAATARERGSTTR